MTDLRTYPLGSVVHAVIRCLSFFPYIFPIDIMNDVIEQVTQSPEETFQLGLALARVLKRGDCVALHGELGSGKTCFTQGICAGLQVREPVTSPTFVLINAYAGKDADGLPLPVYHFDLYRLGDVDELYALGCDDFFFGNGVCLIEWAEMGEDLIPKEAIDVTLTHEGLFVRKVMITGRALC